MRTVTIDIPDEKNDEVLNILSQLEVKVISSEPSDIDTLEEEDCQEHLTFQASISDGELFDETAYLLKSPANAARLLKAIKAYEKSTSMKDDN
ncbi:MAG: hypothetical protein ACXVAY_05830 [Mucilaginibacter sp.]